ncbi:MAG TPA: flagellar type III secretion system protein FlhA, partial [Planctomycetes bacterium]|nr:flagellar type III secretion system protein FlhA [Planctomycetota bacterium]
MDKLKTNSGFRGDALMGFGVIAMIFVLIIPLPPQVLDVLIAVNISFATLILLITLGTRESLELSTYPTLLLLTTLFRLSLNVASTRLILLEGKAGNVIQAFGDFVVGGDLIVGAVIFIILLIIQFVVITKGSGRISEVAARFTLDAMPGKQMAIDADLNAGLISEEEARARREKISSEAEFYGAMDGAGKFVRGDAVAGLIINIINIVGGVAIGLSNNMTVSAALQKYSILTIGDGLVSQTPALIIAVSAGILVTKSSSKEKFASEFGIQLFRNPRALGIGAAAIGAMALIPGFPKLPFLGLAVALAVARKLAMKSIAEAEEEQRRRETQPEPEDEGPEIAPEAMGRLLQVDRMAIEIGYRLIQIVDAHKKGGLLDHIGMIRRQFAREQGIIVPPIRLRDNLSLEPNGYRILIAGQTVAKGVIYPDRFMAMNPGTATEEIQGIRGKDPTFGLPAVWITEAQKTEAELLGYTVVDPISVL